MKRSGASSNRFSEQQRSHLALPGLPLLFAVMEAAVALSMRATLFLHIVQWVLVAVFVVVAIFVHQMTIHASVERLDFGFGPIRRRVRLADITAVRVVDTAMLKLGVGIGTTLGGLMAWIAKPGPAIEIKTLAGSSTGRHAGYIISTSRPHDLASVLQSRSPGQKRGVG